MEAINGQHGDEYREAMSIDMTALQKAVTWSMMHRSQVSRGANILPQTWVYKLNSSESSQNSKPLIFS